MLNMFCPICYAQYTFIYIYFSVQFSTAECIIIQHNVYTITWRGIPYWLLKARNLTFSRCVYPCSSDQSDMNFVSQDRTSIGEGFSRLKQEVPMAFVSLTKPLTKLQVHCARDTWDLCTSENFLALLFHFYNKNRVKAPVQRYKNSS